LHHILKLDKEYVIECPLGAWPLGTKKRRVGLDRWPLGVLIS